MRALREGSAEHVVGAADQVLEPPSHVPDFHDLLRGRRRPDAREMLELHRIVQVEHQAAAEPEQVRQRKSEALCDERVGISKDGAEVAGGAEGLVCELAGALGDEGDLMARGEPARQLDCPDPRAGHARADHVLAVVGNPHRTSHSSASRYPAAPLPTMRWAQTSSITLTRRHASRLAMSDRCTSTTRSPVATMASRSA